ncbi:MAG: DMT family transporter [Lachnospiraceae bacterium]|nr:DMT family transporter [Lachnospiraceae bacterium]
MALFAAAFFWGTTFAAQSIGADYVGPFTYLTIRSYIGTVFLLPFIFGKSLLEKRKPEPSGQPATIAVSDESSAKQSFFTAHPLLTAGVCCGFLLFASSALQQYGIQYSTAANASFITAMYVVIVPILSLFGGKKPGIRIWISVVLCVIGLYLLCMKGGLTISYGDFFLLLCALGFSFQIMTINHFSTRVDGLKLAASEFFAEAVFATVCMLLFEHPNAENLMKAMPSILYAGIFSNGIAYTCQILGQKHVNPTVASLIMCLESVFGTLSGWLILHEVLSAREVAGCIVMFAAILLCTIPSKK